jgi:hypothetical protein
MKYPECEKMKKVQSKSQAIGSFLEWLQSKKIELMTWLIPEYNEELDEYLPEEKGYYSINKNIEELLAEYFGIDLKKIEKEKRQMLDEIRSKQ